MVMAAARSNAGECPLSGMTSRGTIERAVAGDPAAIRELVESLMPDAFRVAASVLGEHHLDLDDAVQMGLLAVINQLPSLREEASLRFYAMRIVWRTAASLHRKRKKSVALAEKIRSSEGIEPTEEVIDDASDPVDQGLRRALNDLLHTLPDAQAETLLLRVVLEYELDEIATEMGVPVNTVRSRLRLAREALRHRIESDQRLYDLLSESALATMKGQGLR
jgi:RNA polymerase sigma factor (sigma-70 family)